jgi:hypothetical protein
MSRDCRACTAFLSCTQDPLRLATLSTTPTPQPMPTPTPCACSFHPRVCEGALRIIRETPGVVLHPVVNTSCGVSLAAVPSSLAHFGLPCPPSLPMSARGDWWGQLHRAARCGVLECTLRAAAIMANGVPRLARGLWRRYRIGSACSRHLIDPSLALALRAT